MEWLRWHLEGNVLAIVLGVLIAAAIVAMAIFLKTGLRIML
jgi:hypothetical protein